VLGWRLVLLLLLRREFRCASVPGSMGVDPTCLHSVGTQQYPTARLRAAPAAMAAVALAVKHLLAPRAAAHHSPPPPPPPPPPLRQGLCWCWMMVWREGKVTWRACGRRRRHRAQRHHGCIQLHAPSPHPDKEPWVFLVFKMIHPVLARFCWFFSGFSGFGQKKKVLARH